jgi:hypothetical protein
MAMGLAREGRWWGSPLASRRPDQLKSEPQDHQEEAPCFPHEAADCSATRQLDHALVSGSEPSPESQKLCSDLRDLVVQTLLRVCQAVQELLRSSLQGGDVSFGRAWQGTPADSTACIECGAKADRARPHDRFPVPVEQTPCNQAGATPDGSRALQGKDPERFVRELVVRSNESGQRDDGPQNLKANAHSGEQLTGRHVRRSKGTRCLTSHW